VSCSDSRVEEAVRVTFEAAWQGAGLPSGFEEGALVEAGTLGLPEMEVVSVGELVRVLERGGEKIEESLREIVVTLRVAGWEEPPREPFQSLRPPGGR
jgi:hypothetical protein